MPMEVATLEAQAETGISVTPGTQKAAALRVLASNPDTAFTPTEIAERTEIPSANASTVCRRLAETGAVTRVNGHYFLTRDEETAAAVHRALGSAHQREAAAKTAAADEATLADGEADATSESLSDDELESELAAADEELDGI